MSSPGNGQPVRYDVHMSAQTRALLLHLHAQAAQVGTGHSFLAAFREILEQLHQSPLDFGEPLYRLPALQLLIRQGVILPLVVIYAVHEERALVIIRSFKLLS